MKVLDLLCAQGHSFEGWFGCEDDFQSQLQRNLVQCPLCENAQITKKLSAPRLNLSGAKAPESEQAMQRSSPAVQPSAHHGAAQSPNAGQSTVAPPASVAPAASPESAHPLHELMRNPEFQEAYMKMAKQVLANTEDVGNEFANEARKIHYGETAERGIRGEASHDDVLELLDEGIDVMPLPLAKALKGTLQ